MGGELAKQRNGYYAFKDLEQPQPATIDHEMRYVESSRKMTKQLSIEGDFPEVFSPPSGVTSKEGRVESSVETTTKPTVHDIRQDSKVSSSDSGTGSLLPALLGEAGFEGEDEIDGPESEAYKTLRTFLPRLIDAIVPEIETLAVLLYSKYLINETTRDAAVNQNGHDNVHKAIRILQYVEHQVKGDETKLRKFIEVLKDSSSSAATVGEEMYATLEQNARCVCVNTSISNHLPPHGWTSGVHNTPHSHLQIHTQHSAPGQSAIMSERYAKKRQEFHQKKYSSVPETPGRTSSTFSTGEDDLRMEADHFASKLQEVAQRQERRTIKLQEELEKTQKELVETKKRNEELAKELKFMKQKNHQLNRDSLSYKKCKAELERYKKLVIGINDQSSKQNTDGSDTTHFVFECKSCQEKDTLIESERKKHEATVENLNTQIGILLSRQNSVSSVN